MVFEMKIIKQELEFEEFLKQQLELICEFSKVTPTFINGSIRNKLDPDNKMETYRFGIIYINEEDISQMQEIDTAFNYIPDEINDNVIYL